MNEKLIGLQEKSRMVTYVELLDVGALALAVLQLSHGDDLDGTLAGSVTSSHIVDYTIHIITKFQKASNAIIVTGVIISTNTKSIILWVYSNNKKLKNVILNKTTYTIVERHQHGKHL